MCYAKNDKNLFPEKTTATVAEVESKKTLGKLQ